MHHYRIHWLREEETTVVAGKDFPEAFRLAGYSLGDMVDVASYEQID